MSDNKVSACGPCGCRPVSSVNGILPESNTNFLSMNVLYSKFKTASDNLAEHNEQRVNMNLHSGYYVLPNLLVGIEIPYSTIVHESLYHGRDIIYGFSDPYLYGKYVFTFNNFIEREDQINTLTHELILGAGIQFPFGSHTQLNSEGYAEPRMQAGYGSWGFGFHTDYMLKHNNAGMLASLQYRFFSKNSMYFKPGNSFSLKNVFFHQFFRNDLVFTPEVGFLLNVFGKDYMDEYVYENDNGFYLLNAGISGSVYYLNKGVSIGLKYPLYQKNDPNRLSNTINLHAAFTYLF
ncbi:MAG: hypothetical protein EA412_12240 [Chitinophagaceae bacterium]|nr:MAG: hypothetical protein EA412_12240 [Chitinophagaceae bacterium]